VRRQLASAAALLLLLATAAALVPAPAAQAAATRGELAGFADHVARVWAGRQDPSGAFLDPARSKPSHGYGNVMIGYALLRAGVRHHDPLLVHIGVRGVSTALGEPVAERGVFDLLSMATAYDFARRHLARDKAFAAARAGWERYLRESGPPNDDNKARACIESPGCFHNHEAVGTTANLALLATGVRAPGLGSPAALRRATLHALVAESAFARPLLTDTGQFPLAYHALSSAMLGQAVRSLGPHAPPAARAAQRRTAAALAGFMAPDGTAAYIGRRQEGLWSLAAAIATAELAGARFQPVADRAFARMRTRYPLTPRGLPVVPRTGRYAFSPHGVDARPMVFNGLTLLLLNWAADAAPPRAAAGGLLPADRDSVFLDRPQNGFAAVRHGDVWFAVHRRRSSPDLRNDFGLMVARWRAPSGEWVDVVPDRPYVVDPQETAGPVVERGGRRILPGGPISTARGGVVRVGGAVPVRFAPTRRGVRISLQAQAGDTVTYTAYLPRGLDPRSAVRATPAADLQVGGRFASCCESRMTGARFRVRVARARTVAFTVNPARAGGAPPGVASPHGTGGGSSPWLPLVAGAILLAAAVLGVRRIKPL
jgi:hypothetical protein